MSAVPFLDLSLTYAPDNQWFLIIMNELFELAGALVQEGVAHNLMRLLAEGTEDEQADEDLRRFAVSSFMDLLEKPHIPDILLRLISWVRHAFTRGISIWRHFRSSPQLYNSVKAEMNFHQVCKLHFPRARFRLRQMHWLNLTVLSKPGIEFLV